MVYTLGGLKKSLSNDQHIKVLETVGRSDIPLSSRQIEKKMTPSNSYIYSIVRELSGMDSKKNMIPFLRVHNKYDSVIKDMQKDKKLVPDRSIIADTGSDFVIIASVTKEDERKQAQINEFQDNIRNYRYSITLKGLLLYLQKSYDVRKIDSVLTNLSVNFLDEFPFLWLYQLFKSVIGRQYIVDLLLDIAIELRNQLDTEVNAFLRYWVMKRYFQGINGFIQAHQVQLDVNTHIKLKHYRLIILQELATYERNELSKTEAHYKKVETSGLFPPSYVH